MRLPKRILLEGSEVLLRKKSTYGTERIYPDCPVSHYLILLTGRQTFLESDLEVIEALGFRIRWRRAKGERT